MLVAAHSLSVPILPQAQTQTQTHAVQNQRRRLETVTYQIPTVPTMPVVQHQPATLASQFSLPVPVPVPAPVQVPVPVDVPAAERASSPPVRLLVEIPVYERLLAAQLAHFASQHHMSEYNRLKTERQRGQPFAYMPLSLQAPDQVQELRMRQAENLEQRTWWISERSGLDTPEKVQCLTIQNSKEGQTTVAPMVVTLPSINIPQEISAAISSQMMTHITKTSESHPINISMVIPSEALPLVASQLTQPSITTPILFHLPENYHLDRLTSPISRSILPFNSFPRSGNPLYLPAVRQPVAVTWSEQGSSDLQNALDGELALPPPPLYVPSQVRHSIRFPNGFPLPPSLPVLAPTPPSPPRGVIRRRQRLMRATSAPPAFRSFKGVQRRATNLKDPRQYLLRNKSSPEVPTRRLDAAPFFVSSAALASMSPSLSMDSGKDEPSDGLPTQGLMLPPNLTLFQLSTQAMPTPMTDQAGPEDTTSVQRLGNLLLSSCPGKKVRLSGPVKGRGTICRDLQADLKRIKELGARCVICCLDDEELDYLGASWGEYSSIANDLGLDVLRIPMPEGLTPLSPAVLDSELKRIIEEYTLRGITVLAHCRGGVGRAGLVACCWMLKLGLLGWKDPQICASSCSKNSQCHKRRLTSPNFEPVLGQIPVSPQMQPSIPGSPKMQSQDRPSSRAMPLLANVPRVCRGTLNLLGRVLAVIRRRRCLKAVETYEQVRFIVDFIEYLDNEAHRSARSSKVD